MIDFLLYLISLIPLRILYFISDFFAFLLYYIFKYRRKVVAENIYQSFRTLSDIERIIIEKKFYRDFCDNFIETIKLLSISEKKLQSHITADYSQLEKILAENQNCHIYLGHQFNWEWANAHIASVLKKTDVVVVYKPLSSRPINDLMLRIRSRFGSKMVASKNMKKEMVQFSDKQHILVLVADQNPKIPQKSFWTPFLSQRTAFLSGTELNTAHHKTPSLFANIIREKRGHYKFVLEPIFDFSEPYKTGIITNIFTEKLENAILSNPENYLWSHKRWKHQYKNEYRKRWINKTIKV
ncbi:lysophospholipid acyltransferase family protein [Flavobacterium sp. MDT1-60]|uniref:lysophospholipid acyltransferase family protein n=1 Tax=Flavobacterium sp. MDT1-60 TaxID=1979344 RepID=UPI0017855A26|nr:lysophospholipid acyltransferase family protein [Flavobacterium sp. MDT1-60]QOG01196.1 lysophospholipid acyltransferase family protein [Flavobacterium sp. MDT1-60]